jgi:hypothetical protein
MVGSRLSITRVRRISAIALAAVGIIFISQSIGMGIGPLIS